MPSTGTRFVVENRAPGLIARAKGAAPRPGGAASVVCEEASRRRPSKAHSTRGAWSIGPIEFTIGGSLPRGEVGPAGDGGAH
jgi:hypothetical protein